MKDSPQNPSACEEQKECASTGILGLGRAPLLGPALQISRLPYLKDGWGPHWHGALSCQAPCLVFKFRYVLYLSEASHPWELHTQLLLPQEYGQRMDWKTHSPASQVDNDSGTC